MKRLFFAVLWMLAGAASALFLTSAGKKTEMVAVQSTTQWESSIVKAFDQKLDRLRHELRADFHSSVQEQLNAKTLVVAHEKAPSGQVRATSSAELAASGPNLTASSAYQTAKLYVEQELSHGIWSEQEREDISSMLSDMNDQERGEIMRAINRSVNDGSLRVEVNGPLFN